MSFDVFGFIICYEIRAAAAAERRARDISLLQKSTSFAKNVRNFRLFIEDCRYCDNYNKSIVKNSVDVEECGYGKNNDEISDDFGLKCGKL